MPEQLKSKKSNTTYQRTTKNEFADLPTPEATELLDRLFAVECAQLDMNQMVEALKGQRIWFSALAIPVSTLILAIFTLLGAFVFDQPVISFSIAALLLYAIAKMIDGQQKHIPFNARQTIIQRIAEIEGQQGLVPHFREFLPKRYRHLWQSLRKGNYVYIDQYIQAIRLLQNNLEPEKFIKYWHLKYPHTAPQQEDEDHPFADIMQKENLNQPKQ